MQMNARIGKNNKLIEILGSLDYFEISEEKALDLALNNNKGIVEITIDEEEHEETEYGSLAM